MIGPGSGVRMYLTCGVTDMRKEIAGLRVKTALGKCQGAAARGAEVAESLARAGFDPRAQKDAAEKARAKARAELIAASSDARWASLRELNAAADSLVTTAILWASPVTVLSRCGLGSPERSAYIAQLTGARHVELTQMATLATATGDKVLGAALVSIIDRMPAKARQFSAGSLAVHLVGDEVRRVQAAIAAIRNAAQGSIVRNRALESGKAQTLDRLKLALNKKETN
ncbi:hypothetical protein [Pseudorhodobacter sp.]|uniref:hypothetical protein n=1 Tax=Pseudorhodobacter sp. TaxID=1934400 RepID=UPI002647ABA5|nr:hypothetical protein [Pseudorhodobacter sp.]MDN5788819.1 hypothetical protein [Pseudorhodobacter sp.]